MAANAMPTRVAIGVRGLNDQEAPNAATATASSRIAVSGEMLSSPYQSAQTGPIRNVVATMASLQLQRLIEVVLSPETTTPVAATSSKTDATVRSGDHRVDVERSVDAARAEAAVADATTCLGSVSIRARAVAPPTRHAVTASATSNSDREASSQRTTAPTISSAPSTASRAKERER